MSGSPEEGLRHPGFRSRHPHSQGQGCGEESVERTHQQGDVLPLLRGQPPRRHGLTGREAHRLGLLDRQQNHGKI